MAKFDNVKMSPDHYQATFTLSPLHVTYANTLRRLILTGVETVAFRADMTSLGTTTDVVVKRNDTPMTNEMLAHRIGLIPIHADAKTWNPDKYVFTMESVGMFSAWKPARRLRTTSLSGAGCNCAKNQFSSPCFTTSST